MPRQPFLPSVVSTPDLRPLDGTSCLGGSGREGREGEGRDQEVEDHCLQEEEPKGLDGHMIGPGANGCRDKVEMQIERRLEDECEDEWMSVGE